jgi:glycosyltransferase involved in cell wall biosynthesis
MNRQDLKILFGVAAPTARGGINACEPPLITALRSLGVECIEEQYLFDNDSSTSLFQRIKQVVRATRKLKRITKRGQIDLIHLNSSFEIRSILRDSFCVLFLGHSKKIFLKFHGSEPEILKNGNCVIRILARVLIKRCAAFGVLSSEEKKHFIALGVPETKIRIIKNSVAPPSLFEHTVRSEVTARLLFVSRLVPTKGLDDAIRTLKILRGMEIHANLDVLGDGESKSDAENLAKELGVEDQVTFHGHVSESEVARFYTKVDLLFFPTKHAEGFPMVI